MLFMVLRKADEATEAGTMPSDALLQAMGNYNQMLVDAGAFIDGTGLKPSSYGKRISFEGGKSIVTDGPFAETHELLAGFTMIQADSMEAALELVLQWPPEDAENGLVLELRPVYGLEDFEPGDGIENHRALADRLSKQPALMSTYLNFDGQCKEAFEFYAECLGGTIETISFFGDMPGAGPDEVKGMEHLVMNAQLRIGAFMVMGSDAPRQYRPAQGLSVQMSFSAPEQVDALYEKLADGAQSIEMPLGETFWARRFASFTDRYGTPWMLNCDKPMEM